MQKCPNPECNTPLQPGDFFCGSCGMNLSLDSGPGTHVKTPDIPSPIAKPHPSSRRLFIVVGSLFGLLLLIGGGAIYEVLQNRLNPPTSFTVTGIALQSGQQIAYYGQTLSLVNADIPLTIQGIDLSEGSGLVWILLADTYGNYYLQTPSVLFLTSREWKAENIRPGNNITSISFVAVTLVGNEEFQGKVRRGDFGAFTHLPQGSQILGPAPLSIGTSHMQ